MEKILLNYLRNNQGQWFKKVHLYVLADEAGYSPETCGRCLRQLANEGKVEVDYYDGKYSKNLAKYSYKPLKPKVVVKDGKAYMVNNAL